MTLLFGEPLPEGNYQIEVLSSVVSASFNLEELQFALAAGRAGRPSRCLGH